MNNIGEKLTKEDRKNLYRVFMKNTTKTNAHLYNLVEKLDRIGFFTAPASTKYHGAYEGGLLDHSLQVARELVRLTDKLNLKWQRPESPYIVGMFHDLCKVDNYKKDLETDSYIYNPYKILDGHGEKSVIVLQGYISLTAEEIACIRWHMGAFETDTNKWKYYGNAIKAYPNVLYTHTADITASHIRGV